jgi:hypothetical protein
MSVVIEKFDIASLCALYDRGRLVPFIGSGMSSPACASWAGLVTGLERRAKIEGPSETKNFIRRASIALQVLRQQGEDVGQIVSESIYGCDDVGPIPPQTAALASLFWPLVCTTNYDDLYLRAKRAAGYIPRTLGRSEAHCREVLEHLSFPASEVVWALQGFLPRPDIQKKLGQDFPREQFVRELVVGHAEYRKEAHRAPHFRRSLAELFRTRSLFFLGSGLGEPYFLSLFDEIIELTGPPPQPHFALIQEGEVDAEFLQKEYHILCNTYLKGRHECVVELLNQFSAYVCGSRVRPSRWGFRLAAPGKIERDGVDDQFTCVRGALPDGSKLPEDEVVAISCGRDLAPRGSTNNMERGQPLASGTGMEMLGLKKVDCDWESDWTVRWKSLPRAYGIVARDKSPERSPRDQRSAEAIRTAFQDFLLRMHGKRVRQIHVQLLSGGQGRVFHPWVSVSQMARAYGEVFRLVRSQISGDPPRANIYLVDPGVIALLQGGHLDLVQQLQGAPLRITVEVIDAFGRAERHHEIVSANASLKFLTGAVGPHQPWVSARPTPHLRYKPEPLDKVIDLSARDFGLVSGSTLFLDFRDSGPDKFAGPDI